MKLIRSYFNIFVPFASVSVSQRMARNEVSDHSPQLVLPRFVTLGPRQYVVTVHPKPLEFSTSYNKIVDGPP